MPCTKLRSRRHLPLTGNWVVKRVLIESELLHLHYEPYRLMSVCKDENVSFNFNSKKCSRGHYKTTASYTKRSLALKYFNLD